MLKDLLIILVGGNVNKQAKDSWKYSHPYWNGVLDYKTFWFLWKKSITCSHNKKSIPSTDNDKTPFCNSCGMRDIPKGIEIRDFKG